MTDLENFAHNLHLRICPLYRQQRRRAFLVGTGIPISTPSGAYIVTATHVLDELHDNIVMTVGSGSLIRFRTPSLSYGYVGGKTVDADVGLLGLPVQVARDLALRYVFTTQAECGVVGDYHKFTLYVVVGYPHTRNKPQPEALATLCATPTFLILREFSDVIRFAPSGKHPEVHFGLSAPLGEAKGLDFRAVAIPKLQGMSGGGVWRVDIDRRDGTIGSTSLVGIVIEYRRAEATIIATGCSTCWRSLRGSSGSLRSAPASASSCVCGKRSWAFHVVASLCYRTPPEEGRPSAKRGIELTSTARPPL